MDEAHKRRQFQVFSRPDLHTAGRLNRVTLALETGIKAPCQLRLIKHWWVPQTHIAGHRIRVFRLNSEHAIAVQRPGTGHG